MGIRSNAFKGRWDGRDCPGGCLEVFAFLHHSSRELLNFGKKKVTSFGSNMIIWIALGGATIGGHVIHSLGDFLVCHPCSGIFFFKLAHAVHHGLKLVFHGHINSHEKDSVN